VNKNEWLQTKKISYDGPAENPLWRHSPPLLSCPPDPNISLRAKMECSCY
jgi:hypothetical protein